MAKTITRQFLKLFGKDGASSNFGQFGSQAAGSPVNTKTISTIQALAAWLNGLQDAVAAGNAPYLQDVNSLFYVLCYQMAYALQDGVPDYDSSTSYYIGSLVRRVSTSEIYASLADDNVGNALPTAGTSNANWQFVSGVIGGVFRVGGALAMNSAKITGLAAGTTNGDALRYEQLVNVYLLLAGGTLTDNLAFNPTTKGIVGTTTINDAAAGNVGEVVRAFASGVNIGTSGQFKDVTSISLTAGDWDISAIGYIGPGPSGTFTACDIAISANSGNTTSDQVKGDNQISLVAPVAALIDGGGSIPSYRKQVSTTTTMYLKIMGTYSGVGSPSINGRISARRKR